MLLIPVVNIWSPRGVRSNSCLELRSSYQSQWVDPHWLSVLLVNYCIRQLQSVCVVESFYRSAIRRDMIAINTSGYFHCSETVHCFRSMIDASGSRCWMRRYRSFSFINSTKVSTRSFRSHIGHENVLRVPVTMRLSKPNVMIESCSKIAMPSSSGCSRKLNALAVIALTFFDILSSRACCRRTDFTRCLGRPCTASTPSPNRQREDYRGFPLTKYESSTDVVRTGTIKIL